MEEKNAFQMICPLLPPSVVRRWFLGPLTFSLLLEIFFLPPREEIIVKESPRREKWFPRIHRSE